MELFIARVTEEQTRLICAVRAELGRIVRVVACRPLREASTTEDRALKRQRQIGLSRIAQGLNHLTDSLSQTTLNVSIIHSSSLDELAQTLIALVGEHRDYSLC